MRLRVKICGITRPDQGEAIAALGADALGFVCVPTSPRFVTAAQIQRIVQGLPHSPCCVGVFANPTLVQIQQTLEQAALTGIQLHGEEGFDFCQQLRQALPSIELIKALRVRSPETLDRAHQYAQIVDTLLLDAYHPRQLGGTGKTIDWSMLEDFRPAVPWLLAGGLSPSNILTALAHLHPDGIDLSSGVERSPGDKDLDRVEQLFAQLSTLGRQPEHPLANPWR